MVDFLKIDKLKSLFICQLCKCQYEKPIILPCGEIICEKDIDLFYKNQNSIRNCKFCDKEHTKTNWIPAKQTIKLMELGGHQIDFGRTFEYGKNVLRDLDKTIREFEQVNHDPNNYIYNYFNELKNQCDIKREEIKMEIDNHFDNLLLEIDDLCGEFQRSSKMKNNEKINSEIEASRKNLNDWVREYDTISIDEKARDKIIFKSKFAKIKLDKELEFLKRNLLKNKSFLVLGNKTIDKRLLGSIKCEELNEENNLDIILFKYNLEHFKNFKKNPYSVSNSNDAGDLKWYLNIKRNSDGYLECYLHCNPECLKNKIVDAEFQIDLINMLDPTKNQFRTTSLKFKEDIYSWGWRQFIKIDDIMENGFYDSQNDSITFEVLIQIRSITNKYLKY